MDGQREPGKNSLEDGLPWDNEPDSAFENALGEILDRVTDNVSQYRAQESELEVEGTNFSNPSYRPRDPNMEFFEDQEHDDTFRVSDAQDISGFIHPSEFPSHSTMEMLGDLTLEDAFRATLEPNLVGQRVEDKDQAATQQLVGFAREFDASDDQDFDNSLLSVNLSHVHEPALTRDEIQHSGIHGGAVEPDLNQVHDTATTIGDPLEYAYANNLIKDHRTASFSLSHLFGPLIHSTMHPADEDGFPDYDHLVELEIPTIVVTGNVKTIETNQEALKLIAGARRVLSDSELEKLTQTVSQPPTRGLTRLELPLLRSDNDWDLRQYQRENANRQAALIELIKNHNLPLDVPDNEKGEGVEPSTQVRKECEAIWKKMEAGERLVVTRDSLLYLVGQIKDDYSVEDLVKYLISEIKYNKDTGLRKITPPASPKLGKGPSTPEFGSSIVPVPSESVESVLSDNLQAVEEEMVGELWDIWSENTSPIRQSIQEEFPILDSATLIELPSKKLEDLRLEVPLMADHLVQKPPPSGAAAFQGFIKEVNLELDPDFSKTLLEGSRNEELKNQAQKEANMVLKCIEQEQLQAVDAIGRVLIPVLDFSIPEPEWKRLRSNANAILKWIKGGNEQLFKLPVWPRDRKTESRMIWRPLTPGVRCEPEAESMNDGECHIQRLLNLPALDEIPSSSNFVVQRKRLAILDLDDGDEDIEAQLVKGKQATDLLDLVKKRTLNDGIQINPKKKPRVDPEETNLDQMTSPSAGSTGPFLLAGDSPGASVRLLSNFLEIHAPKKKSWTNSKYFASVQSSSPRLETLGAKLKDTNLSHKVQNEALSDNVQQSTTRAPIPNVVLSAGPLCIFIAVTVPRRMFRALESMIPGLTVIERDYDAHNTFSWRAPGSVNRTEVVPPLANDADITVSPSMGLVVTSMIKIRQRPRDEKSKNMEQIRLEKVSLRYERLVVLVGESGDHGTLNETTASDATALVELQGFATGLDCNVQVLYVGGGDKILWQWIAAFICRHGLAQPMLLEALLEVETLWELFLRRAGFNVFAAQVVASQMKSSVSSRAGCATTAVSTPQGLSGFVTMTRAERMRRFGQLVGPRVLERVSCVVDEVWSGA